MTELLLYLGLSNAGLAATGLVYGLATRGRE